MCVTALIEFLKKNHDMIFYIEKNPIYFHRIFIVH